MYTSSPGSLERTLHTAGPNFVAASFWYFLFSALDGNLALHSHIVTYMTFFETNMNILNLWLTFGLSLIALSCFILSIGVQSLFNLWKSYTKYVRLRNFEQFVFSCLVWLAFAGFAIAIFSPYVEYTRNTYNYYHILLWVEIMGVALLWMCIVNAHHYLFNSELSPLPGFIQSLKDQIFKDRVREQKTYNRVSWSRPSYNREQTSFHSIEDELEQIREEELWYNHVHA